MDKCNQKSIYSPIVSSIPSDAPRDPVRSDDPPQDMDVDFDDGGTISAASSSPSPSPPPVPRGSNKNAAKPSQSAIRRVHTTAAPMDLTKLTLNGFSRYRWAPEPSQEQIERALTRINEYEGTEISLGEVIFVIQLINRRFTTRVSLSATLGFNTYLGNGLDTRRNPELAAKRNYYTEYELETALEKIDKRFGSSLSIQELDVILGHVNREYRTFLGPSDILGSYCDGMNLEPVLMKIDPREYPANWPLTRVRQAVPEPSLPPMDPGPSGFEKAVHGSKKDMDLRKKAMRGNKTENMRKIASKALSAVNERDARK